MKKIWILAVLAIISVDVGIYASANYFAYLRKAHSTFENYYAFRGCAQLMEKTGAYGTCRLSSGQVIKIVKYEGRWYLDGDLPVCWLGICL